LSHIEITPAAWHEEKIVAEKSIACTGHLPTGDELGGKFWDMVRSHYVQAVDTGHLARFEANHCPFVDEHESTPIVPQPIPMNAPPSVTGTCQSMPMPPGSPGSGSVPEPSSIVLMGVGFGLIVALLKGRARKRAKNRPEFDLLESRNMMSGSLAASYITGPEITGAHLNSSFQGGSGWIYNNGVLLKGNFGVSGDLYYQGGSNYSGTLAISGTAAKFTVNGPVGNGLMTWTGVSGFINGNSGTLSMSFPVLPSMRSDYQIDFDAPPHRPLPSHLNHPTR